MKLYIVLIDRDLLTQTKNIFKKKKNLHLTEKQQFLRVSIINNKQNGV